MMKEEKIVVGISVGDLNGIGGEIILKTFEDSRIFEFCTPVVFASIKVMDFLKKHFGSAVNLNSIHKMEQAVDDKLNVFNCWKEGVSIEFGKEDEKIGEFAFKSLEAATKALKSETIDILLTAPINKKNIQSQAFTFPGHTDYLAQELGGQSLMFMVTDTLKVGLLTDHVPVKDVSTHISPELITQKINTVYDTLRKDFGIGKPKIAVLGINPHTGDNGVIGNEDDDVMRPTLKKIKEDGKLVFGPYAADSFFGSDNYKNFDAIIASYHDQGLIPFKTLSFGQGVNYTAGLKRIRTSPDHGTAYEIAGKGLADPGSFKEALFMGIHVFRNRLDFEKLTANILKKAPRKVGAKK
ncbi:4-hydroxythreonine-4-phosphate dehydrogenase PdxA [Hyunsoonleella rubra]|uniref:4-hydroxythreonine-4-phosphate dehydrogenase PdxA n=1 Tax=Hyunsoonleella rubra TaxID=1737062 RepID=A0ABW5TB39_9FLAO